jgi:hypothetical protein
MARKISVDCGLCGKRVPLEQAKEALFQTANNAYHLMDLCTSCLDTQLKAAQSVNDTTGFRQTAAVLLKLPNNGVPRP